MDDVMPIITRYARHPQPSHYRAIQSARFSSRYGSPRLKYRYRPFRYGFVRTAGRFAKPIGIAASVGAAQFMTRNFRQKSFLGNGYMLRNYNAQSHRRYSSTPAVYSRGVRLPNKVGTNQKNKGNKPVKKSRKVHKNKTAKGNVLALSRQIMDIRKELKSDRSTHIYKKYETADIDTVVGQCKHQHYDINTVTDLEAMIANLRYYDPSTPGTLLTASGATGTFSRDIHFKDIYSKFLMRNNYQVPCRVKLYVLKAKHDNSDNPTTTFEAGITDQVINAGKNSQDPAIYISDIEVVKEDWDIDCVFDGVLNPMDEVTRSHSTGSFEYDPAQTDTDSTAYQKRYNAFVWYLRIEGVLGHDTGADQQTLMLASLDVQWSTKATIIYDAGINLNDIYINEQRGETFTNGGVVSVMPVADNLAYSAT